MQEAEVGRERRKEGGRVGGREGGVGEKESGTERESKKRGIAERKWNVERLGREENNSDRPTSLPTHFKGPLTPSVPQSIKCIHTRYVSILVGDISLCHLLTIMVLLFILCYVRLSNNTKKTNSIGAAES